MSNKKELNKNNYKWNIILHILFDDKYHLVHINIKFKLSQNNLLQHNHILDDIHISQWNNKLLKINIFLKNKITNER